MARPLRLQRPGAWYHITARGNERKPIFHDRRDYRHFCELLAEAVGRFRWRLHAYVLMNNHYHLLLETQEANLSASMQWLNLSYSVWFNRRHQRTGHLLQGRFKAIIVDPLAWGLQLSRYIHLNPVRVRALGLDKAAQAASRRGTIQAPDPAQVRERIRVLRQFRWSSYSAYIGQAPAPAWLECGRVLELIGNGKPARQHAAYQEYAEQMLRQGHMPSPWEQVQGQLILGSGKFLRKIQQRLAGNPREQTSMRQLQPRPGWDKILHAVSSAKGERWEQFRDRHGDPGRDLALYLGRTHGQLKLAELGKLAGGIDYVSVAMAIRRLAQRLKTDKPLQHLLRQAEAKMYDAKT